MFMRALGSSLWQPTQLTRVNPETGRKHLQATVMNTLEGQRLQSHSKEQPNQQGLAFSILQTSIHGWIELIGKVRAHKVGTQHV